MNEEIKIRKLTEEEGGGYLAEYTYLKGCMADGETKIEAPDFTHPQHKFFLKAQ